MQGDTLKVADGAMAGAWIRPLLEGNVGSVTDLVPKGFQAYARVLHPATSPEGHRVTWAEVANARGTTPHGEMQWHAILGLAGPEDLEDSSGSSKQLRWAGSPPPVGTMDLDTLDALCKILSTHTANPDHCFFGLSTIMGWEESFTGDERKFPLLRLPLERDYVVLAGSLYSIDQLVCAYSARREAPNLIWPKDHSWLVASEIDFDSTVVGGASNLIQAIVASPRLEAWQVQPTCSLTANADALNQKKKT